MQVSAILKELEDIVGDQLQVVTYKWLGRHFNVPYDTAKRILFEFVTRNPQRVKATFLLSGWVDGQDGEAARHVVRVVEGQKLEVEKAKLGTVTGMHVYSVQPGVPKDAGDLYNVDYAQTEELFRKLLCSSTADAESNPLTSNLLNTLQCPGVTFDPALAARRVRPAAPAAVAAVAKPAAAVAPAAPAAKPAAAPAKSPPSKPSGGAAGKKGSPAGKKSGASGGGASMAAMWSKAEEKKKDKAAKAASEEPQQPQQPAAPPQQQQQPAKGKAKAKAKPAAKPAKGSAAAKPAAKAAPKAAAKPVALSDDSWEDSEEEEDAPMVAVGHKSKKARQVLEESESEEELEAPPAKRGKTSKAADGAAEAKGKAKGGKKAAGGGGGAKRKKGSSEEEEGGDVDGEGAQEEAAAPSGPKWGSVKVRDPEPGAKRVRREMRTFYNDAGEEVTELVEVEEEDASPTPAQQAPAQQQQQQQAAKPAAAPKPAVKPAGKPGAGSGGSKKGGKGPPPPGQKGIMSFFGKKG